MKQMRNVLLTGATGFVGSALLDYLCNDAECDVRIATRSSVENRPLAACKVFKVGDFTSAPDWIEALTGVDCIVHLAGRAHVMRREIDALTLFRKANTEATVELARQAIECGVKRFIFISSIGVNGSFTQTAPFDEMSTPAPFADYAISKYESEVKLQSLCASSAMELVIIRPPLVYAAHAPGNFQRLLKLAATGIPLPFGCVRNSRSMVALENLVDFIALCIVHPNAANELFLVSDSAALSTPELIKCIRRGMGRRNFMIRVPLPLLRVMTICMGKENLYTQLCCSLTIDSGKARQLLGWVPPVHTEQALVKAGREFIINRTAREYADGV